MRGQGQKQHAGVVRCRLSLFPLQQVQPLKQKKVLSVEVRPKLHESRAAEIETLCMPLHLALRQSRRQHRGSCLLTVNLLARGVLRVTTPRIEINGNAKCKDRQ